MRLVLIEWADSLGCSSSWTPLAGVDPKPLICQSVGWLLHDDAEVKVVVPHVSKASPHADQQGCGDMLIPARSVIRMVDLSEPTQKVRRRRAA